MKLKNNTSKILAIASYFIAILAAFMLDFNPGKQIGYNFITFAIEMLKVLPCAFLLIGLFEVWVKKESIEKHLGKDSGMRAYIWMILLSGTTVGGLYVAFPVAYSLFKKGAKLSVIFTYVGASAVCRIPMMIFEASFMGIKFTLIRLIVSIPLVVLSSIWLGNYLEKRQYKIMENSKI
jgi:uncharacterized membrane protein YraQ (UPF0718 family)